MLSLVRMCGLALVATTATATHAPVWQPAMGDVAPQSATQGSQGFKLMLYNYRDIEYYAKIQVGSPPQQVRLAFDTAASDLAVLAIKHTGHLFFNHSASSTFQQDGRAVRLRDETTGVLARDRFQLYENVAVENQFFTEITNVSVYDKYYTDLRVDGWFGLAPRTTQSVGDVPTILESLFFDKKAVTPPFVGISLPKGENGYVVFGQPRDEELATHGELTYLDQQSGPGLWTMAIDKIDVGDKPIHVSMEGRNRNQDHDRTHAEGTFGVAALDSVEAHIVGPLAAVEAIAQAVGATKFMGPFYKVSCVAPMHDITFWTKHDHPMTVTVMELVGFQVTETDCMFMIRSPMKQETRTTEWSFGLPFFNRYFFGFGFDHETSERRVGYALHGQ